MQELRLSQENNINKPICIALGFFDCVHLGHRELISAMHRICAQHDYKSAVMTFSNNPFAVLNRDTKLIYSYEHRKRIFAECGIDYVVKQDFDIAFADLAADEYLRILVERFNIGAIVCGYDFSYGKSGQGSTASLTEFCTARGIIIEVLEPVLVDGIRVSSSIIRRCLSEGKVDQVNRLLACPYSMSGRVVHGRGEGSKFGIPTANLEVEHDILIPQSGVYATATTISGRKYLSVTNIGAQPTFEVDNMSIETFILDFDQNIYDDVINIEFLYKIRDVQKFSTVDKLLEQINSDIAVRRSGCAL